jgi:hypothetical protein
MYSLQIFSPIVHSVNWLLCKKFSVSCNPTCLFFLLWPWFSTYTCIKDLICLTNVIFSSNSFIVSDVRFNVNPLWVYFYFFLFCSPGWPQTLNPPASTSQVLRLLQACSTRPTSWIYFYIWDEIKVQYDSLAHGCPVFSIIYWRGCPSSVVILVPLLKIS